MQRTDLVLAMGSGLGYYKFTIPFGDLNALAALTATLPLVNNNTINGTFQIPQGGKVIGIMVHATTAFAGAAIASCTVSVGGVGLGNTFFTLAWDIFQAVANNTLQENDMFRSGSISAVTPTATFIVTGANLTALTAGSVDIYILLLNVSTPNA